MSCYLEADVTQWNPIALQSAEHDDGSMVDLVAPNARTAAFASTAYAHNRLEQWYPASLDQLAHTVRCCDTRCLAMIADYGSAPLAAHASSHARIELLPDRRDIRTVLVAIEKAELNNCQTSACAAAVLSIDQPRRFSPGIQEGTPARAERLIGSLLTLSDGGAYYMLASIALLRWGDDGMAALSWELTEIHQGSTRCPCAQGCSDNLMTFSDLTAN